MGTENILKSSMGHDGSRIFSAPGPRGPDPAVAWWRLVGTMAEDIMRACDAIIESGGDVRMDRSALRKLLSLLTASLSVEQRARLEEACVLLSNSSDATLQKFANKIKMKHLNMETALGETHITEGQHALLNQWVKCGLLKEVLLTVGTSNRISSLSGSYKFYNLMRHVTSLLGGWVTDRIPAQKFKEYFSCDDLRAFMMDNAPLLRFLNERLHRPDRGYIRDVVNAHPRYLIENGKLKTLEEMRTSLGSLNNAIATYLVDLEAAVGLLGAVMRIIRAAVASAFSRVVKGNAQWLSMTKEEALAILNTLGVSLKGGPSWMKVLFESHVSFYNDFTSRFKARILEPFERHELGHHPTTQLLVTCSCMFADSTMFHCEDENDRALSYINMGAGERNKERLDQNIRAIFVAGCAPLLSGRASGTNGFMEELRAMQEGISGHIMEIIQRSLSCEVSESNPRSPLFWTLENFMSQPRELLTFQDAGGMSGWRRPPQYHGMFTMVSGAEHRPSNPLCHGYTSQSGGITIGLDDAICVDHGAASVRSAADNNIGSFMFRPIRIDLSSRDGVSHSVLKAHCRGALFTGDEFPLLCRELRASQLEPLWPEIKPGPVIFASMTELYLDRVVGGGWDRLEPFSPFGRDGTGVNPDIANIYQSISTHDRRRQQDTTLHNRQRGIQLYCFRAWLQMYSILNGTAMHGPRGRLVIPFNSNMRAPVHTETDETVVHLQNESHKAKALTFQFETLSDMRAAVSLGMRIESAHYDEVRLPFRAHVYPHTKCITLVTDMPHDSEPLATTIRKFREKRCTVFENLEAKSCDAHVAFAPSMCIEREGNLWEFVFMCTLLRLCEGGRCEGGMATLTDEERRIMLPGVVQPNGIPSALYDLPLWNIVERTSDGGTRRIRMVLDLSCPSLCRLANAAFRIANNHTYREMVSIQASKLSNQVIASDAFALSDDAGRRNGVAACRQPATAARDILQRMTFNPVILTETVPKHKIDLTPNGRQLEQSSQHQKEPPSIMLTSPSLTLAPLTTHAALQNPAGTPCLYRLDRLIAAYMPPEGVLVGDPLDNPALPCADRVRDMLINYWDFMRRPSGNERAFVEVSGIDSYRGAEPLRTALSRGGGCAVPLPFTMCDDAQEDDSLAAAARDGRYRAVVVNRDVYARVAGHLNALVMVGRIGNDWIVLEARGGLIKDDPEAIRAIESNISMLSGDDGDTLDAIMYLARVCIPDVDDYDASLRAYMERRFSRPVEPKGLSFDALYRDISVANCVRTIQLDARSMLASARADLCEVDEGRLAQEVEDLITDDALTLMLDGHHDLSSMRSFMERMSCLQMLANVTERPLGGEMGYNRATEMAKMESCISRVFEVFEPRPSRTGAFVQSGEVFYHLSEMGSITGASFPRIVMCIVSCLMLRPPTYSVQIHARGGAPRGKKRPRSPKDITDTQMKGLIDQARVVLEPLWEGSIIQVPSGVNDDGHVLSPHTVRASCEAVKRRRMGAATHTEASALPERRVNLTHLYMNKPGIYTDDDMRAIRYRECAGSVQLKQSQVVRSEATFGMAVSTHAGLHNSPFVFDIWATGVGDYGELFTFKGEAGATIVIEVGNAAEGSAVRFEVHIGRATTLDQTETHLFYTQAVVPENGAAVKNPNVWGVSRRFIRCAIDRNTMRLVQVQYFALIGFNP